MFFCGYTLHPLGVLIDLSYNGVMSRVTMRLAAVARLRYSIGVHVLIAALLPLLEITYEYL